MLSVLKHCRVVREVARRATILLSSPMRIMDLQIDNNPYVADDFKPKWKYFVDQE